MESGPSVSEISPPAPVKSDEEKQRDDIRCRLRILGFPKLACDNLYRLDALEAYGKLQSQRIGSGFVVAIIGNSGTGKTQMVTCYAADCYWILYPQKVSHKSRYWTLYDLHMMEPDERRVAIDKAVKCNLLVLDEFDKASHTEYLVNTVCHIVKKRHESGRDTIIVSNMVEQALLATLDSSIVSIMGGGNTPGGIIEMTGESLR